MKSTKFFICISKIVLLSQLVISNFGQELGIHKFPKKAAARSYHLPDGCFCIFLYLFFF